MSGTVRVGGQALADGVLMRAGRAWAVARDDGSIEVGTLPPRRTARIPVLRFLVGLASGIRLAVGRGMLGRGSGTAAATAARRRNRRFLLVLAAVEVADLTVSSIIGDRHLTAWGSVAATAGPWVAAFAVLRLVAPASLWRYHGAEHKAVAAYETGVDIADTDAVLRCPRVHDRCGTNLVFLAMLGGLTLTGVPGVFQLPAFALVMAITAEAVTLAAGRPRTAMSRVVLAGGRALQRYVTTSEPTAAEQAVGCRALAACLAHHRSLTDAGVSPEPAVPTAA